MRVNLYTIKYGDGMTISNYDIYKVIDEMNAYNTLHHPRAKMSLTKIRRYLLGNCNIPRPYLSISKTRLNEIIGVSNLASINYSKVYDDFVKTNNYSTGGFVPPPSSPKFFL
jgi:hypothetical protein